MTAGLLTGPIMRLHHCWRVLHVSILAVLVLTLKANSEDSDCDTGIKVHHSTVYEAFSGEDLIIKCTVVFCSSSPPTVSWYKVKENVVPVNVSNSSHIKTEWKELNRSEGISLLILHKIRSSDSGLYQCQSGHDVSHVINVTVHGDGEFTTVTWKNETNNTTSTSELHEILLMYVYSAAGILAFVLIVIIISVIAMHGCKGQSKKETQTENQYMAIPMVGQDFPHTGLPASPTESPSALPSRRSTQRKTPASRSHELMSPAYNEHVYTKIRDDRERRRREKEEEGTAVVYAALNHQLLPRAAAPPWRPQEEFSEYAAIRVS